MPGHLLDLAAMADLPTARTKAASIVANAILRVLPRDEPEVCWARLETLAREVRAARKTRRLRVVS